MANNQANVSVGKPSASGGVWVAPYGTALPTDATTALAEDFKALGYISEDGLVNTVETDTEDIKAWGGDTVLKPQTSWTETYVFKPIETNEDVLKLVYGSANVTVTELSGDIKVLHNSKSRGKNVIVFEILLSGDKVKRIVCPNAEVTEVGEISYVDGEAVGYEITVTALPDGEGNASYEYIAEAA